MAEFNLQHALAKIRERSSEAALKEQANRNAAGRARLDPNSREVRTARAEQHEKALNEEIEFLLKQPDSDLKRQRLNRVFERMAEIAAEQGDYARAASIAVEPRRRKHYEDVKAAIDRDDSENCGCKADLVVDRKRNEEIRSPAMMAVEQIVTTDGLKTRHLCRKCGFQNVR